MKKKINTIIIALLLALGFSVSNALASCTTTYINMPDDSLTICTTCCYGSGGYQTCTTTCN